MPKVEKSALVPVSAEKVFNVVNDVESYPSFVDGCSAARIIESSEVEMTAKLQISKAGYVNEFTTRNELVKGECIKLTLVDGPFDYLVGEWRFQSLDEHACRVNFTLDFKFKNKLMGMALNGIFKNLAESMMSAFIEQAKKA
ncbi:MAG: type II toxin-antitoxin system RatA family toxin [Gammaproteobacteria bacterium]|nr:type II toxin-antitoxin system RatA family toxin [Gammaproteobacteria bacterium]